MKKSKKQRSSKMKQNEQNKELSANKVDVDNRILNLTIIFSYKLCFCVIFATIALCLFDKTYSIEEVMLTGSTVLMFPAFVLAVASIIKFIKISKLSTNKVDVRNKILNLTIIFSYRFCFCIIFATIVVALFYKESHLEEVISIGSALFMLPAFVLIVASIIKFRKISKE